jgi:hypothetical protein
MKFCGRARQSPDQQPYGQSNSHPGYKETSVQMRVLGEIGDDSRSMPPNRTSRCAIRNAIILGKILRSISPDVLHGIAVAISETLGYYVKQSLSRQASGIKSSAWKLRLSTDALPGAVLGGGICRPRIAGDRRRGLPHADGSGHRLRMERLPDSCGQAVSLVYRGRHLHFSLSPSLSLESPLSSVDCRCTGRGHGSLRSQGVFCMGSEHFWLVSQPTSCGGSI